MQNYFVQFSDPITTLFGSGAISGKMLLVGIVENSDIDDYFRAGYVKQMFTLPCRVRKEIRIGPRKVKASRRG